MSRLEGDVDFSPDNVILRQFERDNVKHLPGGQQFDPMKTFLLLYRADRRPNPVHSTV